MPLTRLCLWLIVPLTLTGALAQSGYQEGYVIRNNGDSINGFISNQIEESPARVCLFRSSKRGRPERLSPDQLKAYGVFKGKRWVSRSILTNRGIRKAAFLEHIVDGTMGLMKYNHAFYLDIDEPVLLPKNNQQTSQSDDGQENGNEKTYIDILNSYLSDCGMSANKTPYKQKELTFLVQNYNRCKGTAGTVYTGKLPLAKATFNLVGGADVAQLDLVGYPWDEFRKNYSGWMGLGLEVSSPRRLDRLSLTLDVLHTKRTFLGYSENDNGSSIDRTEYRINCNYFKIPLGIRYRFFNEFRTPYIKVGIVRYLNPTFSYEAASEIEQNGTVSTYLYSYDLDMNKQRGYWAAVGYSQTIHSRLKAFVELRHESSSGAERFISINSWHILAGIRY